MILKRLSFLYTISASAENGVFSENLMPKGRD
jgi:hypothetical protein